MKLKLLSTFILAIFTNSLFSQKIERDIVGIWQITHMALSDLYDYNYENKEVKLYGFMAMGSEEDAKKTKADIRSKATIVYFAFNENNSFAQFEGENVQKGTYEISKTSREGEYYLTLKYPSPEYLTIQLKNSNPKQLITEGELKEAKDAGMDVKQTVKFNLLSADQVNTLKKNPEFRKFETAIQDIKNEKTKSDNKNTENELRDARIDIEKAARLRREETTTNKVYKSNIDLFKAAEIIVQKFESNSIQDIIKNENIKTPFYNDNNLYRSTLSIKDSKLIYISDFEGEKNIHVILDYDDATEDGGKSGYIKSKYYDYVDKIQAWAKKMGSHLITTDFDDMIILLKDSQVKIELRLRISGDGEKSILEVSFYQ
jgi:hypothetical protein